MLKNSRQYYSLDLQARLILHSDNFIVLITEYIVIHWYPPLFIIEALQVNWIFCGNLLIVIFWLTFNEILGSLPLVNIHRK